MSKHQHGYFDFDFTGFFVGLLLVGIVIGFVINPALSWLWSVLKPLIHQLTA